MGFPNKIYSDLISGMASEVNKSTCDLLRHMEPMHPECVASYQMQNAVKWLRETADKIEAARLALISNDRRAA